MYVEAMQVLQNLEVSASTGPKRRQFNLDVELAEIDSFLQAVEKLERIVTDYPSSDIAVKLVNGQPILRGMSLAELKVVGVKQMKEQRDAFLHLKK